MTTKDEPLSDEALAGAERWAFADKTIINDGCRVARLVREVKRLRAELDETRRLLAKATRGELPRCVTCGDRLATRRWRDTSDDVRGLCLREEIDEADGDGQTLDLTACEDLPHALALRAALKANPRRKATPATPETP